MRQRGDEGDLNNLSSLESIKGVQVVQYSSSKAEWTKKDIVTTIKNYREIVPDGQVILVGHSRGADNLVELANENTSLKIDAMIVIDLSDGGFGNNDTEISSNVRTLKNYYQENMFEPGGETIERKKGNKTTSISNVKVTNAGHRTIDNKVEKGVEKFIKDYLKVKEEPKNEKSN